MTTSDDKVLLRDFDIEVNTGTEETPVWTQINGLDEDGIAWAESPREVDFMDADDGGFEKSLPYGYSYTATLKGSRIEDAADGTRDVGQAAVEAMMGVKGAAALLGYRVTSPAVANAETLSFQAWASTTPFGGSDKATWGAVLKVYGEPIWA